MGRPRQITRESIVEAALAIGIDDVTMKSVAARLGVSIGALYRHVRDRTELLRLVADLQLRNGKAPSDVGQHWATLARGYGEMLFQSFVGRPGLIAEYVNGGFPPDSEVAGMEVYLESMCRRGFTASAAFSMMTEVRAAALGAAMVATAMGSVVAQAGDADALVDAAFAARGSDGLARLRTIDADYRAAIASPGWEAVIDRILIAVATERGETLPAGWRE